MLWLALHFPDLPLEIFNAKVTEPLVVLEQNRIYRCNQAAIETGIEVGSTLATAYSINSQLIHQQRDPHTEAARLKELGQLLYQLSSHVSLKAPNCILLEIGSSLVLFGNHTTLSDKALALCANLGHRASARVAATPWAAIALARGQTQQLEAVPLQQAGLELAGIPDQVVERFANMGIYTLGPLLELPDTALSRRFGKALTQYLQKMSGAIPDPREPIQPPKNFQQSRHLLSPLNNKEDLFKHPHSPMQQLAHALQSWLISQQLGCETLLWCFSSHAQAHRQNQATSVKVHFARGKQSATDILRMSEIKLGQTELPTEVMSISLYAKRLSPWVNHSQSLFGISGTAGNKASHALSSPVGDMSELLDELNARLGEEACLGIERYDQHSPESAWQNIPAHRLVRVTANQSKIANTPKQLSQRPLWLFAPPRLVREEELTFIQGPERIQSQWWRQQATHRDYYIAQHHLGAYCWVFTDHQEGAINAHEEIKPNWYLHGYFS